jgi:hypothetical protein
MGNLENAAERSQHFLNLDTLQRDGRAPFRAGNPINLEISEELL